MMAVADRLPSPFKEHVMNEFKEYRSIFPIHDHEFDLVEKGERQGIEKSDEVVGYCLTQAVPNDGSIDDSGN
jgi:hypothetical protein